MGQISPELYKHELLKAQGISADFVHTRVAEAKQTLVESQMQRGLLKFSKPATGSDTAATSGLVTSSKHPGWLREKRNPNRNSVKAKLFVEIAQRNAMETKDLPTFVLRAKNQMAFGLWNRKVKRVVKDNFEIKILKSTVAHMSRYIR